MRKNLNNLAAYLKHLKKFVPLQTTEWQLGVIDIILCTTYYSAMNTIEIEIEISTKSRGRSASCDEGNA